MRTYIFYQLDVFTDRPFTGNPLAVFPEAEGIDEDEMQRIANEMNLSESVFVLPSERALRRLRIFTPKRELPLAGHPVVGTWNLLARLGITPKVTDGPVEILQELQLGVLPVEVEFSGGEPSRVTMTQGKWESFGRITDSAEVADFADGLGLSIDDLNVKEELPIEVVSTGIKSVAVPVRSLDALGRIRVNSGLLSKEYLSRGAVGCYAFTFETREDASLVHARFFAPDDNIPEDAATGSAAGALSGYLVSHAATKEKLTTVDRDAVHSFIIEQGDFMNRPSRVFAVVDGAPGSIERVRIGGSSVVVAKGEVYLS